jgi:glutamate/tyrosine decarboxylase-like PLP-dependent enzyme
MGIENSRRFRALPVYASLHAMGRRGYREMLMRQISLAIRIAKYIFAHEGYTLLPDIPRSDFSDIYVVVLFRAQNDLLNEKLTELINATREVYVSGTVWDNCNATRIAVANWEVDPGMDGNIVERVLDLVWREWNEEKTLVE